MVNRILAGLPLVLLLAIVPGFALGAQQTEAERKVFRELKAKADKGDPQSEYGVGQLYLQGMGVAADPKKAVRWYRKAAEHGFAQAQFQLGMQYIKGEGVTEDEEEALHWFTKAAEQGLVEAQVEAGRCYYTGKGTRVNGSEAMFWFRKAADQGSVPAEYFIGKCYFEGTGVPRDIEAAVKWTLRAAEAGYAAAEQEIALCYERGTGVRKDAVEAYKWYALAAAQDDKHAADIKVSMAKVEVSMTKEQVAEAQRLAREFRPAMRQESSAAAGAPADRQKAMSDSGSLTVVADAADAEVFVDGEFVGNTPAKLKLKEGAHVVEVKKAGFKDFRRQIKVTIGADLNLRVKLEKQGKEG